MAINLIKGQRVEIEAGLTHLKVEMGWKVNPNADPAYDLDASTFLLGSNGQIENEYDFVFYGSGNQVQALDENGKPLYDEEGNAVMRPISVDKSVLGSIDDLGHNQYCQMNIYDYHKFPPHRHKPASSLQNHQLSAYTNRLHSIFHKKHIH